MLIKNFLISKCSTMGSFRDKSAKRAKSGHHFLSACSLKFRIIIDGNRHSASTSILPLSQAQSSKEGVSTCLKELVNEAKTQAASQQPPLCVETGQTDRVSRASLCIVKCVKTFLILKVRFWHM